MTSAPALLTFSLTNTSASNVTIGFDKLTSVSATNNGVATTGLGPFTLAAGKKLIGTANATLTAGSPYFQVYADCTTGDEPADQRLGLHRQGRARAVTRAAMTTSQRARVLWLTAAAVALLALLGLNAALLQRRLAGQPGPQHPAAGLRPPAPRPAPGRVGAEPAG